MCSDIGLQLEYLPLRLLFVAEKEASLPAFLGSTLHGAIGQVLYEDWKTYTYLYRNRNLNGHGYDVVNPYMMVPPFDRSAPYQAGEELCFDFYLFGDAIQYAKPLIDGLSNAKALKLGALRHPFAMKKIIHAHDRRVIWEEGDYASVAARGVALPWRNLEDVKGLNLRLLTPLRIRRNGALLESVDFQTLIRNITRRADALATRYGGSVDKEKAEHALALSPEVSLVESSIEMVDMQRYSGKLDAKMEFGGLLGTMQFEGDISPFVPWLEAARILHIGRNTTFGMGRVEVEYT